MTSSRDPADPADRTGPHDPGTPLTEEEEREVAALLSDAVGQGPAATPPAVGARLDAVLAGLVEERTAGRAAEPDHSDAPAGTSPTVVALEERRRRRLPRVLLAAAAVVVGGYAITNVLDGPLTGDDLVAGSADGGGGSTADEGDAASESERPGGRGRRLTAEDAMSVAPLVRRDNLAADVREVVRSFPMPLSAEGSDTPTTGEGREAPVEELPDCTAPRVSDQQRLYYVRYEGRLAGLVVGPRREGRVDATVYSCRTGAVELSRSVPAP